MRLEHVRRGRGEPLVLLHGIGDSHRAWTPVLGLLAAQRECWALDMPGYGRSPWPDGHDGSPGALAASVIEFMAARGHDSFHVAGNSAGGGAALEIGAAGVARSVCAISPVGFAEGWERAFLGRSLAATRRLGEVLLPRLDWLPLPPAVRRLATFQMMRHGRHQSAADLRATLRELALAPAFEATRRSLLTYRFEGVPGCPVTIAWGDGDRLNLHRPQSARARERLPAAEHVTLAGCGHIAMWDDPEQVARVVLAASA